MAVPGVPDGGRIIAAEGGRGVSLRRHPLLLWVFAICAIAVFARLGVWQLARAEEKRAMLAKAERALNDRRPQPLAFIASAARGGEYDWIEVRGRFADAPTQCVHGALGLTFIDQHVIQAGAQIPQNHD